MPDSPVPGRMQKSIRANSAGVHPHSFTEQGPVGSPMAYARARYNHRTRAFVIGLDHWIQRDQDDDPERNRARRSFCHSVQKLIEEEKIQLVVEEAGRDEQVAAALQRDEDRWAPLENRQPHRIQATEPLAKIIVDRIGDCHHADIRPRREYFDSREEYEQEMMSCVLASLGDTVRMLVLCGEDHRENFSRMLREHLWEVESHAIDWLLARCD
jgi:hypothetical protein